jgi:oligoribonuclease (3'-5' exoribonuclease)
MMCSAIDNPASCEIRAIVRYIHYKHMNAAEIHRELYAVYYQNIISKETERQLCRMFKIEEQMFTMKSEVVGRPSIVKDDPVQSVDQKICERRGFKISALSRDFSQISRLFVYEIVTVRIDYHKFCARWIPKIPTGAHKTQKMASAF